MGRAKTETKRRPKGKKGWRKIDVSTTESEAPKSEENLFYIDNRPRHLTKRQKMEIARTKLQNEGYNIQTIESQIPPKKLAIKKESKQLKKRLQNPTYNKFKLNYKSKDLWDNSNKNKSKKQKNPFVPTSIGISLPTNGDSINPLKHEYYKIGYESNNIKKKDLWKQQWVSKSTRNWYQDVMPKENFQNAFKNKALKKFARNRKLYLKKYLKHKLLWNRLWKHAKNENEVKGAERVVKEKDIGEDILRSGSLNNEKFRRIYGSEHHLRPRPNVVKKERLLGEGLRRSVSSKDDNVLEFLYHELRAQNRIVPHRRNKFVYKKKPILGARFKTSTRIGNVHHNNINNKIYNVVDNDDE